MAPASAPRPHRPALLAGLTLFGALCSAAVIVLGTVAVEQQHPRAGVYAAALQENAYPVDFRP
jgi:hypothetical protein